MIKFAIFDLDGTLLDSTRMWETLGVRYLEFIGETPEAELPQKLSTLTLPEAARYLRENYNVSYSAEEIVRQFTRMTERFYTEEVRLKDGVPKLLAALHSHCIRMSIATACDERLAMSALSRLGVSDFFAGAASCSDYGSKTSPDVFLAAADLIYALPEETIVFEDSLFAVRTAKKAGFVTAALADISERDQSALKRIADFYSENIGDFADNIKEMLSFDRAANDRQ